jgi:CDP-glucose 4,6-dehydratase
VATAQPAVESLVMNSAFWQKKRVLVTGHTGFKGSWLSLWLQMMGAQVIGYSLSPPTSPSLFQVARVADDMHSIIGDIRDLNRLQSVISEHRPEIVFHLAAQAIVRDSYKDPLDTFDTNIMGTAKVLEAIRRAEGIRAAVMITSDKCYENREWHWGYREIDPLGGFDPYSSSKGCAELVTSAYRRSFFDDCDDNQTGTTAISSARAGNVIGGGDWGTDRLVPDILKSFMAKETVIIRNPTAIRPWQFVLEPLRGYLMLAEGLCSDRRRFSSAWNFGPDDQSAKPVQWIVSRLARMWGEGAAWRHEQAVHPHEAHYLKLDCSKANAQLSWQPLIDLHHTLELIVQWYRLYHDGAADMHAETCRQIKLYDALITEKGEIE